MNGPRLTSIDACSHLTLADPPIAGKRSGGTSYSEIDGRCPVHGVDACLETFIAESELARLGLFDFLAARKVWRERATRRGAE